MIYCEKAEFGRISRSFALNSGAIRLKRPKNLTQIGFPSLRSVKPDRLLVMAKTKLMIKKGRILEVRISGCQALGKVSCYGQTIVEKKSEELKFPSAFKLGKGIEIPPPLRIKLA